MGILQTVGQLGIDPGSVLIYLVNFGSLLILLTFFVYRPLLAFLEKRQQVIADSVNEAAELQALLTKEREEMQETKERIQAELQQEVEQTKRMLQEKEAQLLADMEQKRSVLLAQAKEQIDAEKASLMKEVEGRTIEVIKDVVLYVLQNKVPRDVVEDSVADAWKAYTS